MTERVLLDTNVIVAAVFNAHLHHKSSRALLEVREVTFVVPGHCYAEAYNTLTRRGERGPYQLAPDEAWAALEAVVAITTLVGLTPAQSVEAVRLFAGRGGTGGRLFDFMIGRAAMLAGATTIVTWNTRHLRPLFPDQIVETPAEHLARIS